MHCTPLFIAFKREMNEVVIVPVQDCTPLFIAFKHLITKGMDLRRSYCTPLFIAFNHALGEITRAEAEKRLIALRSSSHSNILKGSRTKMCRR